MAETPFTAELLAATRDLVAWFKAAGAPAVVIGGMAVALLARPRVTVDVDAVCLIDDRHWDKFLALGERFGFLPRRADPVGFARQTRMLLVRHQPTGIRADISCGFLAFEKEMIARARHVDVGGVRIPIPTIEDLIIMKCVAHRDIDRGDVAALLDLYPDLDRQQVRKRVGDFAAAMEMPEILSDLEAMLARRAKPKRRSQPQRTKTATRRDL